jgi:hypothetical protein
LSECLSTSLSVFQLPCFHVLFALQLFRICVCVCVSVCHKLCTTDTNVSIESALLCLSPLDLTGA